MLGSDKLQKISEDRSCNCRNSKCMKLYCECFSARQTCTPLCKCCDCHNQKNHQDSNFFRPSQLANSSKLLKIDSLKQGRGCSCRKSLCVKKYCECFQQGILCGPNCKCVECQNSESLSNRGVLQRLRQSGSNFNNQNYCSLFPILLSHSSGHLSHLLEADQAKLQESEMEEAVSTLFKVAQQGETLPVVESFISRLKNWESKLLKTVGEIKEQSQILKKEVSSHSDMLEQ